MKNVLLDKGIILPSGEISKDKVNLVAGAITQPFAEMVWVTTGGDMETINRLTDILVSMNTPADRGKLFKIIKMLYGLMGLPFSEEAEPMDADPAVLEYFIFFLYSRLWRSHARPSLPKKQNNVPQRRRFFNPTREKRNARFFMPSCYAVGAEKALIQAALRARFSHGKGFIPKPSKSLFYCVTNPQQRSDEAMAVFRVEKSRGYTVMSNHHLRNKELSLKAPRGFCRRCCPCRKIGTIPLRGCPISIGKVSTRSAPPYGSLKKPDISQGGRDATKRAKWRQSSTPFMSSRSPRHWKTRYWKIQQRISRYWKIRQRKTRRRIIQRK